MNAVKELRNNLRQSKLKQVDVRQDRLFKLQTVIEKRTQEIKHALKLDLGKNSFESFATEINFVLSEIRHALKNIYHWTAPLKVTTPLTLKPASSYVYSEPYGLVLILSPWNYPFQLCLSPLVGAIAAGNTVVVKPSELAPHTAEVIEKILYETFSSQEVLVVQGGVLETQNLLKEKFDYIFFTGSTRVGKMIMQAAAEHLTPVTLELGGKSPCVVDETIQAATAAKRIAWGKWMNAGQTCVAPDYVLVHKSQKQALVEELKNSLKQFYGDDPSKSSDYGRIISEKHVDRLEKMKSGGNVLYGGQVSRESRYIAPTILDQVDLKSDLMSEEIFGPLLPVIEYSDWKEVLDFVLARSKPLSAYLFSNNIDRQEEWLSQFSFGGGCLNDTVLHLANPELPFGGVGESGCGNYHGRRSFEIFSHKKSIVKQMNLVDVPLRYPPYGQKEELLKFVMR
jgi:aldehyde dehydrogenase (NAD+)